MKTLKYLMAILFLAFICSCGTTKVVNEKIETTTSNISKKDSILIVERNRRIQDSLKLKISQSQTGDKKFDDAVNKAVESILTNLNTTKTSGDNSFSFFYDNVMKELRATATVGPTENTKVINNATVHTKEVILSEKEIPVKFIPRYVLIFAILGGCMLFGLLAFIIYKISRLFRPKPLV